MSSIKDTEVYFGATVGLGSGYGSHMRGTLCE